MGGEEDEAPGPVSGNRKTYWRSASWSASRTSAPGHPMDCGSGDNSFAGNNQFRRCPLPLTPRSQSQKARSSLPPLQPLAIARKSLDEWPTAGSDDLEEWAQLPTPSAKSKPGEALKLDLSSLRAQVKRDQIAFYDKECSKVAEHIYLGGDCVARNREILRQHGITHVLNCVGFVCPEYFKSDLVYKTLWLQDSPTEDITSILYDVFDYFEDVRQHEGKVFVHCCQGVSRSTSLVIAYLMWREGQSFDDAFDFVKAARRIANPNMGFACQLLQCQKRVHAIPLSPNSMLRMYRMAPHSPYDSLHLVPKLLNEPSPAALDSRGAFIIHVFSSINVWIGQNCESVMEKDSYDAAFQVVRYEKVQGPIVTIKEGEESSDFWEAFSSAPLCENGTKIGRELIELAARINVGERKVEAYDVDFELFYKALTGGVVPPFSSPGQGQETHLPARENNWSILRRKFTSGAMYRIFSDSALVRSRDPGLGGICLSPVEVSISTHFSPGSISSDSSDSSKCSSESPSDSPSTSSPPSLAPSPHSSNLSDNILPSNKASIQLPNSLEALKSCPDKIYSPSKGLARSIAERRGSLSPLKLPTLVKKASLLSRKTLNASSSTRESLHEALDRTSDANASSIDISVLASSIGTISRTNCVGAIAHDSDDSLKQQEACIKQNDRLLCCSSGLSHNRREKQECIEPVIYRWPDFERLECFHTGDLDTKSVLLILTPNGTKSSEGDKVLYLWIGSDFEEINARNLNSMDEKVISIDWHQVGHNFLESVGLPKNLPIKVVKEQEMEKILQLINSTT